MTNKIIQGLSEHVQAGVDLMLKTHEQTEKLASKIMEQGKVSGEEAKKIAKEFFEQVGINHKEFYAEVRKSLEEAVGGWKVVSQKQFDELNLKVEELTKKLEGQNK